MYLLFDVGGTKMRLAVSKDGSTFSDPKILQTPVDNFEEGVRLFAETAKDLAGNEKIDAAAGGIAGPLDRNKTMLINAPNINGWNNKPLKKELESALEAPVHIENDTAIVGLGEATAGAARGYGIAVYITVSTGVGGVRIVDGAIDRSAMGFEIGHQYVDITENKSLEDMVSGTAFEKRFGKKPREVDDPEVWDDFARMLAYGLHNTIVHWSPDILVVGGSMVTGEPAISLEAVETHLKNIMKIFPELPLIRKAELGDVGGLYGALAFLLQQK